MKLDFITFIHILTISYLLIPISLFKKRCTPGSASISTYEYSELTDSFFIYTL